jgi:hypothetical protein
MQFGNAFVFRGTFTMNLRFLSVFAAAIALAGCATMPPEPKPLSPDEIIGLSTKAGTTPAAVVATLKSGKAYYALPASELARMSKSGVSDEVINYLQASQLEATRLAERQQMRLESPFWYGNPFGLRYCYRSGGRGSGWITCL